MQITMSHSLYESSMAMVIGGGGGSATAVAAALRRAKGTVRAFMRYTRLSSPTRREAEMNLPISHEFRMSWIAVIALTRIPLAGRGVWGSPLNSREENALQMP